MPLWKLTPTDLTDRNWESSSHVGEVIVRADSENRAREIVAKAYEVEGDSLPKGEPLYSPWKNIHLVTCLRLETSDLPLHGDERILMPEPD